MESCRKETSDDDDDGTMDGGNSELSELNELLTDFQSQASAASREPIDDGTEASEPRPPAPEASSGKPVPEREHPVLMVLDDEDMVATKKEMSLVATEKDMPLVDTEKDMPPTFVLKEAFVPEPVNSTRPSFAT